MYQTSLPAKVAWRTLLVLLYLFLLAPIIIVFILRPFISWQHRRARRE